MKKVSYVLLGAILGAALAIPFSAAGAEVISLIGKTVEGSFPVYLSDSDALSETETEVEAIIVEDRAYVPLRATAGLFNADAAFIDNKIILTPKGGLYMTDEEAAMKSRQLAEEAARQQAEMDEQRRIENERLLEEIEQRKQEEIEQILTGGQQPDPAVTIRNEMRKLYTQKLLANADLRYAEGERKAELEALIADLDAQIADLQAQLDALEQPEPTPTPEPTVSPE